MKAVTFNLDGHQHMAIELDAVHRVLPMLGYKTVPGSPRVVRGLIDLHGEVLPLIDLRLRFGLAPRAPKLSDQVLVIRVRGRLLGLMVDSVGGVMDLDSSEISRTMDGIPGARRLVGAIGGSADIVLIFDPSAFFSQAEQRRLHRSLAQAPA